MSESDKWKNLLESNARYCMEEHERAKRLESGLERMPEEDPLIANNHYFPFTPKDWPT